MARSLFILMLLLNVAAHAQQIAFVDITVIDVEKGRSIPNQTVLVEKDRITYVGKEKKLTAGVQIIDGRGKYLMPGLCDFNAFLLDYEQRNEPALLLFLYNGVTTVRAGSSSVPLSYGKRLQEEIKCGQRVGPRLLLTTPALVGKNMRDGRMIVNTVSRGKRVIDSLTDAGADLVKVDNTLAPEVLKAIVEAAMAQNKKLIGGWTTPFTEAANAGIDAIDHLSDLRRTTSKNREAYFHFYRSDSNRMVPRAEFYNRVLPSLGPIDTPYFLQTIAALKKSRTSLCLNIAFMPNTVVFESSDKERDQFRSARMRDVLQKELREIAKLGDLPRYKSNIDLSEIKLAHQDGVRLLFGTGVYNFGTPGFTVHDGFYWMQQNGFSPAEILRTATVNIARFMNEEDSWGSIDKGKRADLLLLSANPLEDITHTKKITAVMASGRLFQIEELKTQLHTINQSNTNTSNNEK